MPHPHSKHSFRESRTRSFGWEWAVFWWLVKKERCSAMPPLEWPIDAPEGPRYFIWHDGMLFRLMWPDIDYLRNGQRELGEVKSGKGFCWSDYQHEWQTSFDVKQCRHYHKLSQELRTILYIYMISEQAQPSQNDRAKGCDATYLDRGLYRISMDAIEQLKQDGRTHENHGEIYIPASAMDYLTSYEEIKSYIPEEMRGAA